MTLRAVLVAIAGVVACMMVWHIGTMREIELRHQYEVEVEYRIHADRMLEARH
jgi:hypothetical protein